MKDKFLQMTSIILFIATVIINPARSETVRKKINTVDGLEASIDYIMNTYFNLIYYKDRLDLEMKHHGDSDPRNPVMLHIEDNYNESLKQFKIAIDSIKSEQIELSKKERTELFKKRINISRGSRLIGLFAYINITSKNEISEMKEYYIETAKLAGESVDNNRLSIVKSWKSNQIPIPIQTADGTLLWKSITPFDFISKSMEADFFR